MDRTHVINLEKRFRHMANGPKTTGWEKGFTYAFNLAADMAAQVLAEDATKPKLRDSEEHAFAETFPAGTGEMGQ